MRMRIERRKATRETTFQPVWLLVEFSGNTTMRDAFLLDASPYGVRIQLSSPLTPRQIVGYIRRSGYAPTIQCEVKWVSQQAPSIPGQAGLEFLLHTR